MFTIVLLTSLSINVLCLLPYVKGWLTRDHTEFFNSKTSDEELLASVLHASLECNEPLMIQREYKGLRRDINALFEAERNSESYNNYYMAYNWAGVSQYAIMTQNKGLITQLCNKADEWIGEDGKLCYPINRIDQCPIGIMYLNLYKITKEKKYLFIATQLYEYLKSKRIGGGNIIPYCAENNLTDALGMFVPFLMEYYSQTNDSVAKQISIDNVREFQQYALDEGTHMPFHGYNFNSGLQVGSCNWGRGIGWYLLAIAYCQETNDNILQKNIEKLNYTQFPLSSTNFDSSTALMFEIYKQSTTPQRKLNLDFIRTHVRRNGYVSDCSGDTYGLNDYSHSFGNSELCNGLLLILVSKFSNR